MKTLTTILACSLLSVPAFADTTVLANDNGGVNAANVGDTPSSGTDNNLSGQDSVRSRNRFQSNNFPLGSAVSTNTGTSVFTGTGINAATVDTSTRLNSGPGNNNIPATGVIPGRNGDGSTIQTPSNLNTPSSGALPTNSGPTGNGAAPGVTSGSGAAGVGNGSSGTR